MLCVEDAKERKECPVECASDLSLQEAGEIGRRSVQLDPLFSFLWWGTKHSLSKEEEKEAASIPLFIRPACHSFIHSSFHCLCPSLSDSVNWHTEKGEMEKALASDSDWWLNSTWRHCDTWTHSPTCLWLLLQVDSVNQHVLCHRTDDWCLLLIWNSSCTTGTRDALLTRISLIIFQKLNHNHILPPRKVSCTHGPSSFADSTHLSISANDPAWLPFSFLPSFKLIQLAPLHTHTHTHTCSICWWGYADRHTSHRSRREEDTQSEFDYNWLTRCVSGYARENKSAIACNTSVFLSPFAEWEWIYLSGMQLILLSLIPQYTQFNVRTSNKWTSRSHFLLLLICFTFSILFLFLLLSFYFLFLSRFTFSLLSNYSFSSPLPLFCLFVSHPSVVWFLARSQLMRKQN